MTQYEYKILQSNQLEELQAEGLKGWMVASYDYKVVLLMRPIQTAS